MAGRFWHVFNSKMTKEAQRLQKMGESVLSVPYFARTFRERDKELDKVIRHGQPMTLGEGRRQVSFNPLVGRPPGLRRIDNRALWNVARSDSKPNAVQRSGTCIGFY